MNVPGEHPAVPPVVAVWATHWLPGSRTYISDHVRSLQRYRPWLVGRSKGEDPFDLPAVFAPFPAPGGNGPAVRVYWKALHTWQAAGFRPLYSTVAARHRPALIHAHFTHGGLAAAPLSRSLGVPLVISVHGDDVFVLSRPASAGDKADDTALRARWPEIVEATSLFLAPSRFMADALASAGVPAERIRVHYLGVRPPAVEPPDPADRAGIVFVGRLSPVKGADHLLRAVAALPEALRATPVRVVGDGPQREALRRRADELGLDVTFTGQLPSSEVEAEYRRARVLVGCSGAAGDEGPEPAEAFGQVNLEAAGTGLPAVVYGSGGVSEAVLNGRTGLVVDVGDTEALSRAIAAVLTDDELARDLGARARLRVLSEMNIVERTRELEQIYDEVVAGRQRKERA